MKSLCIFGDSTTWGAWDIEKGGWVNRLWLYVNKNIRENYILLYNQSISGGTSATILERFENEARSRKATMLIFQTGCNDSSYKSTPENFLVLIEKFQDNLEEIIKRAKKITDKIIFIGLRNCDESKTMPVSWADIYYSNENITRYNEIIKDVCIKNDVLFLDIMPLAKDELEDGLHSNMRGHQKIFTEVKNFLIEKKWI